MLWSWGLLVCHSFICVAQFLIYFIFYFKSHFLCGVFCTTQFKITSLFLAFRSLPPLVLFIIVLVIAWIGSVAQFSLTLCDPKNCRTPGIPVHHKLLESTQTHVHWVDAIQPSHPLSTPSLPALNLSHHQGLFKWVILSHQVANVLEFQLQHQSFQWTPRTIGAWVYLWTLCPVTLICIC